MRRTALVRKINREARRQGVTFKLEEGGRHTILWVGGVKIPVPRHPEISERTTQDILHECEAKLGKGWWRS